ncbi:TetR/AcrR family transcriptional regulator [Methanobacterium sp.]|jgi:AcrR family transcriptional regulator|uniref:TetR/AcrR family transcriptional regulator n=1 Tax=unclassified Methanobacterium TaxID=2627676 RepID=UPI0031596746
MEQKSFKRKNELIEAALDEFTAKNYENASLNIILKNAGISKGTFYYHFQDKQAFYVFLLQSAHKAECKFINDRMKGCIDDLKGKDIFERFKVQVQIAYEFAVAFPKYFKLGIMFRKERESEIYEYAKNILERNKEAWLEERIKKAIKDGDFNNRFSEDFILKILNYMVFHFNEMFDEEEDYKMEKVLENSSSLVDFLKYGFGNNKIRY